jgi:hypothetical protein
VEEGVAGDVSHVNHLLVINRHLDDKSERCSRQVDD